MVEWECSATYDHSTRQYAIAIGIEHESERDGDTADRSRQLLVTIRQAFSKRTDLGAAGQRPEPAGERRWRAAVRFGEQHVNRYRGAPAYRHCLYQPRDRFTWPRPGAQPIDRCTIDVDDQHLQLRCWRPTQPLVASKLDVEGTVTQYLTRGLRKQDRSRQKNDQQCATHRNRQALPQCSLHPTHRGATERKGRLCLLACTSTLANVRAVS